MRPLKATKRASLVARLLAAASASTRLTLAALESVLALTDHPKAAGAEPKDFFDNGFLKELEDTGFIRDLYGQ